MQKKLLTMAVASALAAPVAALADVSVYGSIDTGIKQQSKVIVGAGDESQLSVTTSQKKTNRWGVRGSEDLGGGLMVNFTLEGAYDSDTGDTGFASGQDGIFARRAVVGLSKGGNSVDLGREYTLNFQTHGIYDPLSHDYGGAAGVQGDNTAGTRTDNAITGKFRFGQGGVAVQYAPGEVPGEGSHGTYTAFSGDMTFGPAIVGVAFGTEDNLTGTQTTDTTNLGGAYKMGAFTFRLGYSMEETDGGGTEDTKLSGGVQYDFSPVLTGRLSYYDFKTEDSAGTELGKAKVFVVNVEYSLSKRTLLYGVVDRKDLSGNQVGPLADGATGIGAGIVHNF